MKGSDEKPLRVQVSEALGWRDVGQVEMGFGTSVEWFGVPPGVTDLSTLEGDRPEVPPYGDDSPEGWAATGPLLTRFDLWVGRQTAGSWVSYQKDGDAENWLKQIIAKGASPCEAIARCVVALAAAGKLPR